MTNLYSIRESCRGCLGGDLKKIVALNPLPVSSPNVRASAKITEQAAADLWQCADCGMVQLKTHIDAVFQYVKFQYSTGISVGLREHFEKLIAQLATMGEIDPDKFVLDVGSNDGSLLKYAQDRGCRVLGIDPAETVARKATAAGIPTIADFFNKTSAQQILSSHGHADVIISNNTVANIDDLDSFFESMKQVLTDNGIIVIETQYMLDVLQKFLLDVVYHEHINYFSVKSFDVFLQRNDLMLIDAHEITPKGGSVRFIIQRKNGSRPVNENVARLKQKEEAAGVYSVDAFQEFQQRVQDTASKLKEHLRAQREQHGRAVVWGASVGCAALINYFDLAEEIDAIFDDTPLNNYLLSGGKAIPVLSGGQLENEIPSDVLVFAWRYTDIIAGKYADFVKRGGCFTSVLSNRGALKQGTPVRNYETKDRR